MEANPADPAPRHALLQLLIDQDRYDEALALTDASLKYAPKDANLLFDRGVLAFRRGQTEEALTNWNDALEADPSQSLPHLYIATQLDREGKAEPAALHYAAFLQKIAEQKAQDRPSPDRVIAILLRMADCQARSSQAELAVRSYHVAEKLAVQTQQPKLESVAYVNEAALHAKAGKPDEALQLYQHALHLDQSVGDDNASAQDWYAYSRFLDDAGLPARLAYACVVKSVALAPLPKDASSDPRTASRAQLEKKLGPAAAAIRRNPEAALREALSFRRERHD